MKNKQNMGSIWCWPTSPEHLAGLESGYITSVTTLTINDSFSFHWQLLIAKSFLPRPETVCILTSLLCTSVLSGLN